MGVILYDTLAEVRIRLGTQGTSYQVSTYTLLDALGQIGGIYELIILFFSYFISFLNEKLLSFYIANFAVKAKRRLQTDIFNQREEEDEQLNEGGQKNSFRKSHYSILSKIKNDISRK